MCKGEASCVSGSESHEHLRIVKACRIKLASQCFQVEEQREPQARVDVTSHCKPTASLFGIGNRVGNPCPTVQRKRSLVPLIRTQPMTLNRGWCKISDLQSTEFCHAILHNYSSTNRAKLGQGRQADLPGLILNH